MHTVAAEWGPSLLHWLHSRPPSPSAACLLRVGSPSRQDLGDPSQPAEGRPCSQTPHNDLITHTHTQVCVGERPPWRTGLWVNFSIFPLPFCIFQFFCYLHYFLDGKKKKALFVCESNKQALIVLKWNSSPFRHCEAAEP